MVLEVRGKRKLLDDSRNPKVVKKALKHSVFLISPDKRRVGQKSFERNSRGQKVVKTHVNYNVFVKVGSSKSVKNVSC